MWEKPREMQSQKETHEGAPAPHDVPSAPQPAAPGSSWEACKHFMEFSQPSAAAWTSGAHKLELSTFDGPSDTEPHPAPPPQPLGLGCLSPALLHLRV